MHMPKVLQPTCWMKAFGRSEDTEEDHTCPWCGETFPLHCPETGELLREQTGSSNAQPVHEGEK